MIQPPLRTRDWRVASSPCDDLVIQQSSGMSGGQRDDPYPALAEVQEAALEGAHACHPREPGDARSALIGGEVVDRLVVVRVDEPDVRATDVVRGVPVDASQQIVACAAERDAAKERDRACRRERERAQRRRLERR